MSQLLHMLYARRLFPFGVLGRANPLPDIKLLKQHKRGRQTPTGHVSEATDSDRATSQRARVEAQGLGQRNSTNNVHMLDDAKNDNDNGDTNNNTMVVLY